MTAAAAMGYDVLFVVHVVAALVALLVLLSVRWVARAAPTMSPELLARRCPDRPDVALRLVHVVPVTGLALSAMGSRDVSLTRPWILTGIVLYLVLAAVVESRVAPAERALARTVVTGSTRDAAATLGSRVDGALVVIALLFVTMIVQF